MLCYAMVCYAMVCYVMGCVCLLLERGVEGNDSCRTGAAAILIFSPYPRHLSSLERGGKGGWRVKFEDIVCSLILSFKCVYFYYISEQQY